jgi:hypothetical protein
LAPARAPFSFSGSGDPTPAAVSAVILGQDFGGRAYAASFDCGDYLGFLEKTMFSEFVRGNLPVGYIEAKRSDRKRGYLYRLNVVAEFGFTVIGD